MMKALPPHNPNPCVRALSNADDQGEESGACYNTAEQAANDDEMIANPE
jgi:hypothetical protein